MSGAGTSFALFLDSRARPAVSQSTFGEVQRCQRAYNQPGPRPKDRAYSDGPTRGSRLPKRGLRISWLDEDFSNR